jgi:hypothetical protein
MPGFNWRNCLQEMWQYYNPWPECLCSRRGKSRNSDLVRLSLLFRKAFVYVVADTLYSQEAARGAGFIMDQCSRGDGTVMGENHAWASRCLLIHILAE